MTTASLQLAAPRRAYADTRLGQMNLHVWPGPAEGSALAVVCLHPIPYSGRYFDAFAAELSQHCSVVAPDLMGYGSSAELAEPVSIEDHAAAVADALQDQGFARYTPLGFHTGSAVAGELALARPKRVERLIFITYPLLNDEERAKQLQGLGRGSLAGEDIQCLGRRWRFTVNSRAAGVPLERALINFTEELRAGDNAWMGFHSMFSYTPEARLPKVNQPVLVLNVEGSLKDATRLAAELLPAASYNEFTSMSRGIFELHAAKLAGAVSQFLEADLDD
ncbi:MAG: alpha/beta fold hydrolase [Chromatiales bacterium]|nr:MAG: alpha/beta fold hydrolase [Chromatiales bacterium]